MTCVQTCCIPLTILLIVIVRLKKGKLNRKISLYAFFVVVVGRVDGAGHVCALMVARLHIETFATVEFDPSLVSRPITDPALDRIK